MLNTITPKEKVRPITYLASIVAFVGVMIILRPNFSETGAVAFLPLVAAFFMALMVIANRAVAGQGSGLSMQVFIAGFAAPALIVAAFLGRFSDIEALQFGWPSWNVVLRCMIAAVTASCAQWLIYMGTTRASAASIAPMSYVQLLVAIALGWLLFRDTPDSTTILGAAVIIGAGLVLWRAGGNARRELGD